MTGSLTYQSRELDGHICSTWLNQSQQELWKSFCVVHWTSLPLIPPLFPTHKKARLQPGPVQRRGLSDPWHNANLCPPQREPPCAVASSSEKALFSATEMMITEMRRQEGENLSCYITSREESDLCRELRPQTSLSLQHQGRSWGGGRQDQYSFIYFSANKSSVWLTNILSGSNHLEVEKKHNLTRS